MVVCDDTLSALLAMLFDPLLADHALLALDYQNVLLDSQHWKYICIGVIALPVAPSTEVADCSQVKVRAIPG